MRSKAMRRFGCILLATLLSIGFAHKASAAALALRVEAVEKQGQTVETQITALQCEGLSILQFDLIYDPKIAEPETVVAGLSLPKGLVEYEQLRPGALSIAVVSNAPVNGPGELLRVQFRSVAPGGGKTQLDIADVSAWDHEKNLEMQVTTEAGSLTFKPESALSGLPRVSGLALAIAVVIVVMAVLLLLTILFIVKAGRAKKRRSETSSTKGSAPPVSCAKCGTALDARTKFCTSCGQSIAR